MEKKRKAYLIGKGGNAKEIDELQFTFWILPPDLVAMIACRLKPYKGKQ